MPIKMPPATIRSNSLPNLAQDEPRPEIRKTRSNTVFETKPTSKTRHRILNDVMSFINNEFYNFARIYIKECDNMLSVKDILFIKEFLNKKTAHKNAGEKVLDWIKYYAGHHIRPTSTTEIHKLHEELDKQIKIKIHKSNDALVNELFQTNSLGINGAEYAESFALWIKGKNQRESQINLFHWRKFIAGCHKVKELNEQALNTGAPLIPFQGLHKTTNDLFMEISAGLQNSAALLAEPDHFTKMNGLVITCIDRVAPDPSSDADSYISLHEPNDGAASRIVHNVTAFARIIFQGPPEAQAWYIDLIKQGSQWHMRGTSSVLTKSTILQSFEWQRNDDQSLSRKIAMTTYMSPHIKTHTLTLNVHSLLSPFWTQAKEMIALRLLKKLANKPAENQERSFDNWLNNKTHVTPHDEGLRNLLNENPNVAKALKTEFITFLKTSSEIHARFIYDLSVGK